MVGSLHRRYGVSVFESMPMGGYGGWFGGSALTIGDECALNEAWLGRASWPVLVLTSAPGRGDTLPAAHLPRPATPWRSRLAPRIFTTHLLDLNCDDATLVQRVTTKMRGYLRKVDHMGFEFDMRQGISALTAMHRWYLEGSRAWQRPADAVMSEGFFTALGADSDADVWTVRHRGTEVGAALFLTGNGVVQYQASGTQRIESPLSAMEALLWSAVRHYRDRGMPLMNLGASDGLAGVARFKEKFGAVSVPYRRVLYVLPRWWRPASKAAMDGAQ